MSFPNPAGRQRPRPSHPQTSSPKTSNTKLTSKESTEVPPGDFESESEKLSKEMEIMKRRMAEEEMRRMIVARDENLNVIKSSGWHGDRQKREMEELKKARERYYAEGSKGGLGYSSAGGGSGSGVSHVVRKKDLGADIVTVEPSKRSPNPDESQALGHKPAKAKQAPPAPASHASTNSRYMTTEPASNNLSSTTPRTLTVEPPSSFTNPRDLPSSPSLTPRNPPSSAHRHQDQNRRRTQSEREGRAVRTTTQGEQDRRKAKRDSKPREKGRQGCVLC